MRRVGALVLCAPLVVGCSDPLSAEERAWADGVVLSVAAVNDVMALEVLTALVPATRESSIVVVNGPPDPDWPALEAACGHLQQVARGLAGAASHAPGRFADAASALRRVRERLAAFTDGCVQAASARDLDALQDLSDLTEEASDLLLGIFVHLPSTARCPDDVRDRPQTCDVAN